MPRRRARALFGDACGHAYKAFERNRSQGDTPLPARETGLSGNFAPGVSEEKRQDFHPGPDSRNPDRPLQWNCAICQFFLVTEARSCLSPSPQLPPPPCACTRRCRRGPLAWHPGSARRALPCAPRAWTRSTAWPPTRSACPSGCAWSGTRPTCARPCTSATRPMRAMCPTWRTSCRSPRPPTTKTGSWCCWPSPSSTALPWVLRASRATAFARSAWSSRSSCRRGWTACTWPK